MSLLLTAIILILRINGAKIETINQITKIGVGCLRWNSGLFRFSTLWFADRTIPVVCPTKAVKHLVVIDPHRLAEILQGYSIVLIEKQSHFGGVEAYFFFLVDHSLSRIG